MRGVRGGALGCGGGGWGRCGFVGGAGVDDVGGDGGAVVIGDAGRPAGGLGEEGRMLLDGGVVTDVGEGCSGADDDGVGCVFDEVELLEVPEGDELAGLEVAGAEGDHEFGASGDGGVVLRGVGEDLQDRVEGGGGDEVVLVNVGAHKGREQGSGNRDQVGDSFDCFEDAGVAGAAAEVAVEALLDL